MSHAFNTILIIDDIGLEDVAIESLRRDLEHEYRYVRVVHPDNLSHEEMREHLSGLDLAIVDWELREGDTDGREAQAWIELFTSNSIPVVIYTGRQPERIRTGLDPRTAGLVLVISKSDAHSAVKEIEKHLKNCADLATRVGLIWKPSVRQGVLSTLQTISSLSQDSFELLRMSADKDDIEIAHALTELFQQVLAAKLNPNIAAIGEVVGSLFPAVKGEFMPDEHDAERISAEKYEHLTRLLTMLAYDTEPRRLDTGDIIRVSETSYGVVITPRCDLARPQDDTPVCYVDAVPARDLLNEQTSLKPKDFITDIWMIPDKLPGYFGLFDIPHRDSETLDLVALLGRINTKPYSDITKTERIARIRSPFLDSLIYSLVKHYLRYGMPSFPYFNKGEERRIVKHLVREKLARMGLQEAGVTS